MTSTIIGGAIAAMAVPAFAQDATAPAAAPAQELVVTGSRIPHPNMTSISPIQTVNQKEFKLEGTVNVETTLNNLPQVMPSSTQFQSGGGVGEGLATVDLRGFGPQRTLVLVDGRRMPPGDAQEPVADLNLIPSSLVENVDVLTGGAASIYGSDAIAGVVNFKMKHNFQGVQLDAQYSFAQHDNNNSAAEAIMDKAGLTPPTGNFTGGETEHVTVAFGGNINDGRGNFEGYLGYIHQDPVLQGSYDTEACTVISTFSDAGATGHACSGSSNSAYGNFQGHFYGALDGANWVSSNTLNPVIQALSNNPTSTNFVAYASPPPDAVNRAWNYAPHQYLQRQDERYQGGFFSQYDISSHITAYSDFMFEEDSSTGQLAPSGLFTNGQSMQINCADPLMSAAQQQAICGPQAGNPDALSAPMQIGYRLQNEPREYLHDHTAYKMDFGFRGDIDDAWSYDVYGQYGRANSSTKTEGDVSLSRISNALNAVPDGSGGAMCADPAARASGCVPFDIFQPLSAGVTDAQFNYIEEDATVSGYTTEDVASANIVGKLGKYGLKSPWADEGLGVALGVEYRHDFLSLSPDAASESGDLAGAGVGGTPKVSGSTNVKEVYGELSVPVVSNQPFFQELSLDLSYRYSKYNLAGGSSTYKIGGDWAVNPDLRFRAAYSRTERAPNVLELFIPQTIQNASYNDPCSGPTPQFSADICYRTANLAAAGVSLEQFEQNIYGQIAPCPAGECNQKTGGNTALRPEIADTWTGGFVVTPHFLRGFVGSVDYWDVKVLDAIGTLAITGILDGCYSQNISSLCAEIFRDPTNGTLNGTQGYVSATKENLNSLHKRGIDFQLDYRFEAPKNLGGLDVNFAGTYDLDDRVSVPIEGEYNCAGLFGATCGEPSPRWRHKARVTWSSPWNIDVSMQWRYLSRVDVDVNDPNPILNAGFTDVIDAKIPAYSYFDLTFAWRFRQTLELRGGINNIFDKDPPVLDTLALPLAEAPTNSWTQVYDPLGRTIFINLTAKF